MKFGTSLRFLNENCTPLASQILDFLTESLQGIDPPYLYIYYYLYT